MFKAVRVCLLFVVLAAGTVSAATFTVSNTNATGPGSLVDAISQANVIAGPHTINVTASGTMNVTAPLVLTQSMTINGPLATPPAFTIDGGNATRIIQVSPSAAGPMTLTGIALTHGRVDSGKGGAIDVPAGQTLNLSNCLVTANATTGTSSADIFLSAGGAISTAGTLNIQTSTISNNTASGPGGAIYSASTATVSIVSSEITSNQITSFGGAMFCDGSVLVTITNSTFFGNQSGTGGGGAIGFSNTKAVIRGCTFMGNVTLGAGGAMVTNARTGASIGIENSTFSGNTADFAGAFYAQTGTTDLRNVTITANAARRAGGGFNNPGSIILLRNTIVAGNTVTLPGGADCSGAVVSNGYNLIGSTDSCTGLISSDVTGYPAALASLSINGGPTLTHLPALSSPAVDAGNPAGCLGLNGTNLTVDQRGLGRPFGARCDIGAVEVQATPPPVPPRHRAIHH